VAAYITAAYGFTASTSFANPAVTLARSATDTFAGIRPAARTGSSRPEITAHKVAAIATCSYGASINPSEEKLAEAPALGVVRHAQALREIRYRLNGAYR
jgi:hypothetical protein